MTKEEAIYELKELEKWYVCKGYNFSSKEEYEAIKFAIKYMEED